jgi:hypothetical protein
MSSEAESASAKSHGLSVRQALMQEWYNGREALIREAERLAEITLRAPKRNGRARSH